MRESPEDATEQQIGIHVFQRPPGYNSSQDSIVRSHARLLRKKLEEHFANEGVEEALVIEIPKGQYLPVFRPVEAPFVASPASEGSSVSAQPAPVPVQAIDSKRWRSGRKKLWLGSLGCLLFVAASAAFAWHSWQKQNTLLDTLWQPFVTGPPPLVVYSNALFVPDSDGGVKVVSSEDASEQNHDSTLLTGTGAVMAVRELTRLFDIHGASFILKRSRLVSWDDARATNLIFIGSRSQNLALRMLPGMNDFSLIDTDTISGYRNLHPKPGEPASYSRAHSGFDHDYAVIALLPGLQPGRWTLIFSGLSTLATEAAVEYGCRAQDVAALLRAASIRRGELHPFEALLETQIVGGVPLHARLVTVRSR